MNGHGSAGTSQGKRAGVSARRSGLMLKVAFLLSLTFSHAQAQDGAGEVRREAESSSAAAELERARRAIDEGNARAVEAWAKGDAELILSVFAEDSFELRPDGSVVRGKAKILELMKASMKRLGPGVELTVKTTSVWLDGGTAYETGKSVYKYKAGGQPKTFETLYVSIWKKQRDGAWKLYVDMPVPRE
ncbi:MAG TPA: nuclear transport factor 2 family protein [Pyrinomonadaceae bacterium]|nr:nuclear transport factor 2 family protein [Pyrinomonadaceae bacterium]